MTRLQSELPQIAIKVGVVHYSDDGASTSLKLTDIDKSGALTAAIGRTHMGRQDSGRFTAAANQALRVLDEGRRTPDGQTIDPCQMVVFFAYNVELSAPDNRPFLAAGAEMQKAGSMLLRAGVTVVGVCTTVDMDWPGGSADPCQHIREIAQGAGGWYAAWNKGSTAMEVVDAARHTGRGPTLSGLWLDAALSDGLAYVGGSGAPPPRETRVVGLHTSLHWPWQEPDASVPHTVTYAIKPLREGAWPITGTLGMTDTLARVRVVPVRPLTLTVSGLCETPTPPPSPTATAEPSATPTAPPEDTPTARPSVTPAATVTDMPRALLLPLALRESCDPEHRRADVALVVDTSSSMAGRKLEDAKTAAVSFVRQMDLAPGRDQVAVVRFDAEAEVVCRLTNARAVIEAAIRNLTSRSGTHIHKGLRLALAELQSPRRTDRNLPVIVLLTDGRQTGTPGEELRAAEEVRTAGVQPYTIGLGADVDAATLREMAGDDSRYHFAPDSADLARIYSEIASDIVCPAPVGGFWPGR